MTSRTRRSNPSFAATFANPFHAFCVTSGEYSIHTKSYHSFLHVPQLFHSAACTFRHRPDWQTSFRVRFSNAPGSQSLAPLQLLTSLQTNTCNGFWLIAFSGRTFARAGVNPVEHINSFFAAFLRVRLFGGYFASFYWTAQLCIIPCFIHHTVLLYYTLFMYNTH